MQQHSFQRVILTLAHGLYTEAKNCTVSIDNANLIFAAGRRIRQELSQVETNLSQKQKKINNRVENILLRNNYTQCCDTTERLRQKI